MTEKTETFVTKYEERTPISKDYLAGEFRLVTDGKTSSITTDEILNALNDDQLVRLYKRIGMEFDLRKVQSIFEA